MVCDICGVRRVVGIGECGESWHYKTTAITGVPESVSIKKGKTYTLKAKAVPKSSEEKFTYRSSNKKVATVSKSGKVKGVKKGTATITIKSGKISVKVTVTVK